MSNKDIETSGHRPAPKPKKTLTTSTRKPPSLQHDRPSTTPSQTSRLSHSTQKSYGSFPTTQTDDEEDEEEEHGRHPSTLRGSRRAQIYTNSLSKQQHVEQKKKKADRNRGSVEDGYIGLNPWYDGERERMRPVFGMSGPFPRVVRRGMGWGRDTAALVDGFDRGDGEDDRPLLHLPLQDDESTPPDAFDAEIDGNFYEARRVRSQGGRDHRHREGEDEGFSYPRSRYTSNLGPVEEETRSLHSSPSTQTDSYETDEDRKEAREHDQNALQDYYNTYRNPLARLRAKYPEAPAEFLCTMIYVFFGIAGSLYSLIYPATTGDYQTPAWAWGMAVMAGIFVGGGVSGAHMSPWISVCFSVFRGFPWRMCLVYSAAQIVGGLAAGGLAWAVYRDGIRNVDPGLTPDKTGAAFYSTPASDVSFSAAFCNNVVSAALYVCVAFAVGDDSNTPPGSGMSALIYGLLTYLLTITMGYNGLGISPARDLGPRFIAWWAGYGPSTFSTGWWAYGPIFGGLLGSLLGALVYDVFIFEGGESPVNWNWPTVADVMNGIVRSKERVRRMARGVDV